MCIGQKWRVQAPWVRRGEGSPSEQGGRGRMRASRTEETGRVGGACRGPGRTKPSAPDAEEGAAMKCKSAQRLPGKGRGLERTASQVFNSETEKHPTNMKPNKKAQCLHGSASLFGMNHIDPNSLAQSVIFLFVLLTHKLERQCKHRILNYHRHGWFGISGIGRHLEFCFCRSRSTGWGV